MEKPEIHEISRRLFQAHGDRAEYEAAQKARELAEVGRHDESADWKRICQVVAEMRGPNYS